MTTTHSHSRTALLGIALLGMLGAMFLIAPTTNAGPQENGGGCGEGWNEDYYVITNPWQDSPPGTVAYDLEQTWNAVYGTQSGYAVVSSGYSYATISGEGGLCGDLIEGATLPTAVILVNPSTIQSGNSATLTWGSGNASSCTGTNFSTGGATSGTISVSPTDTTSYSVSCTDGSNTANASTVLTVTDAPVPAPTVTLSADPSTVTAGDPTTLTWTSTNADSCVIDNGVGAAAPAAGGSVTANPGVTTTYTITCTGDGGEATAATVVTVNAGTGPDLTAGSVSPTSAILGESVVLSALISNIGNASTGSGFQNVFQFDNDSNHSSGVTNAAGSVSGVLAAAGSANTTNTHTFNSEGTWYVRVCADNNTSMTGLITETNEGNNCGPWTSISVSEDTAGAAVSCTVDKTNVAVGEQVTYTANPSGGAGAPYVWTDTPDAGTNLGSGTVVNRTYTAEGTYAMQVSATGASSAGFCPNVTVGTATCPGTPSATISATPDRVRSGSNVTITWSAQNVQGTCTITGPGVNQTVSASACVVPETSITASITAQSVYRISCTGASDTAVVNLLPLIEEF